MKQIAIPYLILLNFALAAFLALTNGHPFAAGALVGSGILPVWILVA